MNFAKKLKRLKSFVLDLLFPVYCLGCKKAGQWLCDNCLDSIQDYSYKNKLLKNAIHVFKYKFVKDLAKPLSKILIKKLRNKNFDYIIPVPLHSKRLRWRGFNQAGLLAKHVGAYCNTPLLTNILIKTRKTKPQVEFSEEQRKQNIKNSFKCLVSLVNKRILLIDDVETTGSTLQEAKKELLQAGAKQVYCLTLAKT